MKVTYRKHGELNKLQKRVHPYHIAYVNNQWTLFAFDPKRKDTRKFVLFRLTKPELTGERFNVPGKFDLNKELSGSLGVFKGGDDYQVVVDFDAWGADDVRGQRWHASQELACSMPTQPRTPLPNRNTRSASGRSPFERSTPKIEKSQK